jgi:hypothetical protein
MRKERSCPIVNMKKVACVLFLAATGLVAVPALAQQPPPIAEEGFVQQRSVVDRSD